MKPRYMLDTNICIYLMKHQPETVQARFAACYVGDVVMSAITLAELEFGVASSGSARKRNQKALDELLHDIPVAPFATEAARAYGSVRAANRQRNRDALDKLIASHAIALGVTLVTNKETDFKDFENLTTENWVSSTAPPHHS